MLRRYWGGYPPAGFFNSSKRGRRAAPSPPFFAPLRQDDRETLAPGAVEDDVDDLRRQFPERRIQAEAVVLRHAVEQACGPVVLIVLEDLRHERAAADAARLVRHEQVGMDVQVDAQPETGAAGAARHVEREVERL